MHRDEKEQIFNFGKLLGKSCKLIELEGLSKISEEEWRLCYENVERGLNYNTWIQTVQTIQTMKQESLNFINEDEFFRVFNIT